MHQVQNITSIKATSGARPGASAPRFPRPARQGSRIRRTVEQLVVLGALTLGFLIAPTLQGLTLVADQSAGASAAIRTADAAASAEVVRLTTTR
jgi:uncharacterized membrane protein